MRLALSLLFAAATLTAPAVADQFWTPDWKFVPGDGSQPPSDCVGSNATLNCLIDTIVACSAWSEGPEWRADQEFFDHPVCNQAPGFEEISVFSKYGPLPAQLFIYATDHWRLSGPEEWLLFQSDWALARAGDTVVDFFSITCSPDPACLAARPASALENAPQLCPRTFCSGGPFVASYGEPTAADDPPAGVYVEPEISLLVRNDADGWRVISWYDSFHYGLNGPQWLPDHWKRK
jgi:hypothetical protein